MGFIITVFVFCCILFKKVNPSFSKAVLDDNEEGKVEVENNVLTKRNEKGQLCANFRILTCTDMHLCTDEYVFGLTVLERMIEISKPDLIILLGDNAVGRIDNFIEEKYLQLFEKKQIHYCFVLGNHDSETIIKNKMISNGEEYEKIRKIAREYKFKELSKSKYCVASLDNQALYGIGNYRLKINNTNKTLFFFDSSDYAYGIKRKALGSEKRSYDYLHEDQLEWFKKESANDSNEKLIFFHIPLYEFHLAYLKSFLPFSNSKKLWGNNYEKPCFSDIRTKAFEIFKENKTKLIMCGHDHKNDACINYQNVLLTYSLGLQYDGSYNRRKKARIFKLLNWLKIPCYCEGVSIIDLNKNEMRITPLYAEKQQVFEGLERYYPKAFFLKKK